MYTIDDVVRIIKSARQNVDKSLRLIRKYKKETIKYWTEENDDDMVDLIINDTNDWTAIIEYRNEESAIQLFWSMDTLSRDNFIDVMEE